MNKEKVNFVFSINVHEKPDFFFKQYDNICENIEEFFIVILNCNNYMYNQLKDKVKENIILNPHIIEKKHGHGTLFYGIYSNMLYANAHYTYDYFVVLSSRNMFYNKLNSTIFTIMNKEKGTSIKNSNLRTWGWPRISTSILFKNYQEKNGLMACSAHEGFVIDYNTSSIIINFLKSNTEIFNELINFNNGVEEWALQLISINESDGFYDIGNGVDTHNDISRLPTNKFTHKISRN